MLNMLMLKRNLNLNSLVLVASFLTLNPSLRADDAELANLTATSARLQQEKQNIVSLAASVDRASQEFTAAWKQFSDTYTIFLGDEKAFGQRLATHIKGLNEYNSWMSQTSMLLVSDDLKDADFVRIGQEYKAMTRQDNICTSTLLLSSQKNVLTAFNALTPALARLKDVPAQVRLPAAYDPFIAQMNSSVQNAEESMQSAGEQMADYAETLGQTQICSVFANFDVLLSAAQVIRSTQAAAVQIDKLNLKSYLKERDKAQSIAEIRRDSERYMRGVEGSFLAELRAGNITKSLLVYSKIDATLEFGLADAAKVSLPSADAQAIEQLKAETKQSVLKAAQEAGFPELPSFRQLAATKARSVQAALLKLSKKTLADAQVSKFADAQTYCLNELNMKSNAVFTVPSFLAPLEAVDFDAKLTAAQQLLKGVEE